MDDTDFKNSLGSHRIPQEEGADFLTKLKTASPVRELASKGMDAVAKNKMPLIGAAIGAAVAAAVQYMDNKPKKDGGPSTQRETAEKGLAASEKHMATQSEGGKQPSFSDKMNHEKSKFRAGAAQVMEKHPVRGAAFAAPMGAAIGFGAGRLGETLLKNASAEKTATPIEKAIVGGIGLTLGGAALSAHKKQKTANGDMLQYYQGHPKKLKEKQERDAKKEKKAGIGDTARRVGGKVLKAVSDNKGAAIGAAGGALLGGTAPAPKGKKKTVGQRVRGAVAGGLYGGAMGHLMTAPLMPSSSMRKAVTHVPNESSVSTLKSGKGKVPSDLKDAEKYLHAFPQKTKKASVEMAEAWARDLAKEKVAISFNQANEASKFVGRVSRLWEKHGPAVKNIASKAGKKAYDGVSSVGKRMGDIKDPIVKGMATGGAIGGVGGAAQGFLDPKENPYTGEKQRLRTAFRKGMAGAAGGAVSGALIGSMNKSSAAIPGLGGIGSMAKNFVSSMAPTAHKAVNAATPTVRAGIARLGGSTMGQAAGAGAVGGAALGAAKGLVAPGTGPNGQKNSRLGAMARGAVGGAALGGAAGAGAKAALPKVRQFATKKLMGG